MMANDGLVAPKLATGPNELMNIIATGKMFISYTRTTRNTCLKNDYTWSYTKTSLGIEQWFCIMLNIMYNILSFIQNLVVYAKGVTK